MDRKTPQKTSHSNL